VFIHLRHELELVHCDDVVHFSNLWIWFVACRRIGQLGLRICVFNGKFNLTGSCSRPSPFLVSWNYYIWIPSSAPDDVYLIFFAENSIKRFFLKTHELSIKKNAWHGLSEYPRHALPHLFHHDKSTLKLQRRSLHSH